MTSLHAISVLRRGERRQIALSSNAQYAAPDGVRPHIKVAERERTGDQPQPQCDIGEMRPQRHLPVFIQHC